MVSIPPPLPAQPHVYSVHGNGRSQHRSLFSLCTHSSHAMPVHFCAEATSVVPVGTDITCQKKRFKNERKRITCGLSFAKTKEIFLYRTVNGIFMPVPVSLKNSQTEIRAQTLCGIK